jgi:hypothetical protein
MACALPAPDAARFGHFRLTASCQRHTAGTATCLDDLRDLAARKMTMPAMVLMKDEYRVPCQGG